MEQLNKDTVRRYRNRHKLMRPGHTGSELDDAQYLEMIGAAAISSDKQLHPTAAGLLMFGDEFRIVREFPEYFLDYREMLDLTIRWTDRFYSSTGDWSGNLFDFYFGVYNRIIKDIKGPFKMVGGDRIDDTPVHKALREVLANCLVNTDFYVPRGVVIKKDADKLVLENPGYIRVGKPQMLKGGESDPRNKALMKMFNMIDIGERAGSGVPTLFSTWKAEGWKPPVIEERFGDASRTTLTLPFQKAKSKSAKRTNDHLGVHLDDSLEKKIIKLLGENNSYTLIELAERSLTSTKTVQRTLKKLKESGTIKRVGGKRYGHWEVHEE